MRSFLVLALLFLFTVPALAAEEVRLELSPKSGPLGTPFQLELAIITDGSTPISKIDFDESRLFSLERIGQEIQRSIVNSKALSTLTLRYLVKTKRELAPGKYRLPDGRVSLGATTRSFTGPYLRIIKSEQAEKKGENRDIAFIQAVSNYQPYVGEQITYRAEVAADARFKGGNLEDFELSDFWRERITTERPVSRRAGSTTIHSFVEVLIPSKSGEIRIPPRALNAQMLIAQQGSRRRVPNNPLFSDLFSNRGRVREFRLTADELQLQVKPLPAPPPHEQNYIPVGDLRISSEVDLEQLKLGESLLYTIQISGTANLRPLDIPEEDTSDYKRYDEEAKLNTKINRDKLEFSKRFRMALIPTKSGTFEVPQFRILYFDPQAKQYSWLTTEPRSVEVLPSDTEGLNVRGLPEERKVELQKEAPEEKQDIQVIGHDLRPQKLASSVLNSKPRLSPWLSLSFLLIAPLAGLGAYVYLKRKLEFHADTKSRRFEKALEVALQTLRNENQEERNLDMLRSCLLNYLNSRLDIQAETLTPSELRHRLATHNIDESVVEALTGFRTSLDNLAYSGSSPEDIHSKVSELENLLTEFDKATHDRYPNNV